jgi:maltodextrin utilization protein YvdJ
MAANVTREPRECATIRTLSVGQSFLNSLIKSASNCPFNRDELKYKSESVINLNENNSSISSFLQKESSEQNSDNKRNFAKEERTLSDPEDKGVERNLFKERPTYQQLVIE